MSVHAHGLAERWVVLLGSYGSDFKGSLDRRTGCFIVLSTFQHFERLCFSVIPWVKIDLEFARLLSSQKMVKDDGMEIKWGEGR